MRDASGTSVVSGERPRSPSFAGAPGMKRGPTTIGKENS